MLRDAVKEIEKHVRRKVAAIYQTTLTLTRWYLRRPTSNAPPCK